MNNKDRQCPRYWKMEDLSDQRAEYSWIRTECGLIRYDYYEQFYFKIKQVLNLSACLIEISEIPDREFV